ncbi:DUF397 domain-containing protein [Nocardia sp. NPDC005825]|uniref:DUF397 domain-containing protein n=1 Tax=unclassified Nocardia TaxID=2637762 RepID=UPI0033F581D8
MKNPPESVWYKSTRSDGGNYCVEVRHDLDITRVRDTKDHGRGPILSFTADMWTSFIESGIWSR